MIKCRVVLLLAIGVDFITIPECLTQFIKHPAKVTINKARASLPHSFDIKVEGNCKTWNLELAPMENVWSDVAQVTSVTKEEKGTTVFERKNIPKNLKAYRDVQRGSVLSIRSNEITGILDSNNSIICENKIHFIVELEGKPTGKIDDVLIADEIPPMDYIVRFDEDTTDSTETDAVNRMSGARKAKQIYTPEVLVIVDSELSNLIGTDSQIYDYLTLFWNGVKVQYQYIKDPVFNIRLIGAVIIRDAADEPFITNNLNDKNQISSEKALVDLGKYIYSSYYMLPHHDIVYLQTNKGYQNNRYSQTITKGACKIDAEKNRTFSIGVGADTNAVFWGTLFPTHIIGHLMGADHDDLSINSCDPKNGYLMTQYPMGTKNSYYFSNCSLESITTYLASGSALCLQTQFKETRPPGRFSSEILPGYIVSMKEQCRYFTGDSTADIDTKSPEDKLCYNLRCITRKGKVDTKFPAAEGSLCPSGKRCSFGACV